MMKVAMWATSPSPHQSDFYAALRQRGVDLRVLYLEHLDEFRRTIGWSEPDRLPDGEIMLPADRYPLDALADWRERIHIIPGYSRRINRSLAVRLSRAAVPWVHWSERSRPVWHAAFSWAVKRWYAGWVNRAALGAFATGQTAERDFLRWGIHQEKIAHLYYAVNGVSADTRPDAATSAFVGGRTAFVFAGSLCQRKACDVLLKAFSNVCSEDPHVVLVLVGDEPRGARYRRLAQELGVAGRVLFRGVLPPSAIGSVLVCCHSLVLPSRFDGWGVVLNEGASAGLALIATERVGAAYHLIEPGWNGFIAQSGKVESLAEAMRSYATDPRLAEQHGRSSLQHYQRFTPEANSKRFMTSICGWLSGDRRWRSWTYYHRWLADMPSSHLLAAV